ncbi:hypothetical protein GWK47_026936 [Chionoecetes opilio]|uniref:CCHC-type domain-containing protein n=1 Tax=Chionoecetes opilio TaxID=41210 RepID=A0A8J8WD82_CHIOP|nr:hypothetical protein GWK47_026936 [Chionoecetes opilio]
MEQLANLLVQQTALSAQREERMVAMIEWLLSPFGGVAASSDHRPATNDAPARLPAAATPAPFLTSSASLRDFAAWKIKFNGYMLLTRANNLPPKEQRAILLSLLDEDWNRVIRYTLQVAKDTPAKEIVMAIEAHLRTQRNVLVDRREFYSWIQEEGETLDDFLCSLKEIASFCDFYQHCFDTQLRDHVVCGARDNEAAKAMLANKDLTLNNAVDVCRASEVARNTRAELRSGAIGKVSAYQRQRSQTREYGATRDINQKCTRCGYRRHTDFTACPAISATCRNCGESGHFQSVCGRFDVDVSDTSTERTT